jgi:hypothetical protein
MVAPSDNSFTCRAQTYIVSFFGPGISFIFEIFGMALGVNWGTRWVLSIKPQK